MTARWTLAARMAVGTGALLALTAMPERTRSDAGNYASQRRQVRVGIIATRALNMPNGEGSENPDPHVFYVLDARTDLKPVGVELVNPLAPPTITGEIYERWRRRSRGNDPAFIAGNPLSQLFRVGAKVTKNMGAYWEVNIDALEASDLQQFDLLYLHTHKPDVALPADTREKLRAYIDGGGTLWVEQCGGFTFNRYAPFFFDAQFRSGGAAGGGGRPGAVIGTPNHPLLTAPYVLTAEEVQTLGDKNVGGWYIFNPYDPADPSYYDPTAGKNALNPPGRETLVPVVWNTRGFAAGPGGTASPDWRPYVLAGAVGSGKLIMSAQDTGCAINDYVGGVQVGFGGNCGAISGQNLLAAKPQDLKFAYNLLGWATSHRTAHADVRRTGSGAETVAAQLDEKWAAPGTGPATVGGVAFLKGVVFAVGGDLVLRAFDVNPGQDLDGDGNPDDGLVDFNAGVPYDCIWALDLNLFATGGPLTGASAPTVVEFFDPNPPSGGGLLALPNRELVVVTLSNGAVVAARALPQAIRTVNGRTYIAFADFGHVDWAVSPMQTNAQDFALGPTDPVPAPAFSEGVIFVALNTSAGGRVLAIDPATGGSPFRLGVPAGVGEGLVPDVPGTEALRGSPTVGYVRDTLTGASDKMVYVNVSPRTGQPASIRAIPFSVKGEPLTMVSAPDRLFRSRARSPWYIYLGAGHNPHLRPRVTCIYRNPSDGTYGSRELQYTSQDPPGNNQWVERFDMGEARVKVGAMIELTNVERPDGTRVGLRNVTPTDPNVTIVADYVYDWAPPASSTLPKVNARSVFIAPDPTDTNNVIVGTAALGRNDTAYFAGNASNNALTYPGRSILIAAHEQGQNRSIVRWTYSLYDEFTMTVNGSQMTVPTRLRTNAGVFLREMRFVGTPAVRDNTVYAVATGTGRSVLLAFRAEQEFILRLNTRIETGTRVRIRQPNLFVDRNTQPNAWVELAAGQYTVDYDSGLIRVTAMAPPGAIAAAYVSASVPFVVQVGNGPEQVSFPTRADADGWRRGGPDNVDNLLWFCVLPGIASSGPSVQGDTVWVGLQDGRIVSMDADPSVRNPEYQANGSEVTDRWVSADPRSVRPVVQPPAAVNGTLAIATASGVFVREDTVTLIADASRLIEVNSAGDAVWWCDGTRTFDIVNGPLTDYTDPNNPIVGTGIPAGQRVPFRRPSVARRMSNGDILVVDTGNNRVVAMDRGGYTKWEVNRLQDDYKRLLRPGDPLSLNEPTDCTFWTEFQPNVNITGGPFNYQGPGYIVHYLIADSGNFRIVELIDVYSASGERIMVRQVNFVSSTLAKQGKRYRYRSVQRLVMRNSDLPAVPGHWRENPYDPGAPPLEVRFLTMATVTNARMADPSMPLGATLGSSDPLETGGGSVAILKETGDPLAVVTNLRIPVMDGAILSTRVQPIVAPTWFSSFQEAEGGSVVVKFLLADANGVYQARLSFVHHAGSSPPYVEPVLDVEWLLTAEDYALMTGKRLQATGITRLSASAENPTFPSLRQFVIANRFSGEDNPGVFGPAVNITGSGEFRGEVFTIKPSTFNYGPGHGYVPDYSIIASPVGGFLWPNDGGTYVINGIERTMPQASIIRRTPTETVPRPPYAVLHRPGDTDTAFAGDPPGTIRRSVGDKGRGTSTSILEQPSFADRPF